MKLCIPVSAPDGLASRIEPDLAQAKYLLFFDTETRSCSSLSLRDEDAGAAAAVRIDSVLCARIDRTALRALTTRGITVYATEAQTAAQAVARYEEGKLDVATGELGECAGHCHAAGHHANAGCHGDHHCAGEHSADPGEHHCGGKGGGCAGHENAGQHAQGSCCASAPLAPEGRAGRPPSDVVKIAVSSQNRKTVTEHAGKCRKFWIFEVRQHAVVGKTLVELAIDQSFHRAPAGPAHPLDSVDVLLTAGIGSGLQQRLRQRGVQALVTMETDPGRAVAAFLAGVR